VIREFLPVGDLLSYVEAILRVYNRSGRRDNIHKARIKILVKAMGLAAFRAQVEAEWQASREFASQLPQAEVERIRACFRPHAYATLADTDPTAGGSAEFRAWYRYNTHAHKVPGYRVVFVSLKPHGAVPGDISSEQMEALAELADRVSFGEVRATHGQNLLLADVQQAQLHATWEQLRRLGLATPNVGTLTDMIACPGLDFCSLANAGTISVARQIQQRFDDFDYLYDVGEIELKMSGCMNACGHHHVGHIGILGVDKHGEEWYQITIGGSARESSALGEVIGPSVPQHEVAATLWRILEVYRRERTAGERFIDTVRRIGVTPFKESVYAHDLAAA
jgi:sulfite reductase (NADPH) hemoprotein beta-component